MWVTTCRCENKALEAMQRANASPRRRGSQSAVEALVKFCTVTHTLCEASQRGSIDPGLKEWHSSKHHARKQTQRKLYKKPGKPASATHNTKVPSPMAFASARLGGVMHTALSAVCMSGCQWSRRNTCCCTMCTVKQS